MFRCRTALLLGFIALLPNSSAIADLGGELSLYGTWQDATIEGEEAGAQSMMVRYATGDRNQFRLDIPVVRALSAPFPTHPGSGGLPPGPGGPGQGPGTGGEGNGSGSGGEGSGGSGGGEPGGGGSGSTGGGSPSTYVPPDGALETPGEETWASGFGDVRLAYARRVVGGGVKVFRLDVGAAVKAPTANADDGLGTGEWDFRVSLLAEYRFWSSTAFGGVGWNSLGDPAWVELQDGLDAHMGVESDPLRDRIVVFGWLEGWQEVVADTGDGVAVGLGLRSVGRTRFKGEVIREVVGPSDGWTVTLGVAYGLTLPTAHGRGLPR